MTKSGSKCLLTIPYSINSDHRGTIYFRFLSHIQLLILYKKIIYFWYRSTYEENNFGIKISFTGVGFYQNNI